MESKLKKFMKFEQLMKLGKNPTYHSICFHKLGVSRPGKTAKDAAMAAIRAKEKEKSNG